MAFRGRDADGLRATAADNHIKGMSDEEKREYVATSSS
jgi:hypothetical protein